MDQIPGSRAQRTTAMKHSKAIQWAIAIAVVVAAAFASAGNNVTQQIVYSATSGGGLVKGGTAAAPSFGLIRTCSSSQVLKWSGSAWACGSDNDSGGTVTAGTVGIAWFGDGSDGDAVMDGTNDYASLGISKGIDPTPAQGVNVHYYSLGRDTYFHDLTIGSGQKLFTGGWRVFVTGTLTLTGDVGCWGNDGTAGDGSGTGGAGGPQRNSGFLGGSGSGGVGRRGVTGNGSGGAPPGNAPRGFSNSPGGVGKGGVGGGTGTSNGGTITVVSSALSGDLHNLEQAIVGKQEWSTNKFGGGSGGGGGIGANGTYGGGGGAGGCPTIIRARSITGAGKTVSFGGYGGAGFTNGSGTGGGGGGGGGGWVVVVVGTGSFPSYDITGGNAGTGVAPAAGAGGVGQIYQFNVGTP